MKRLTEIADVIRSKNSGPYELTFDVIFNTRELYDQVCAKNAINKDNFAALYKIPVENIMEIVHFDPVGAIKVTIVRPIPSGGFGETDVYGAQQHAPLMSMEVDI